MRRGMIFLFIVVSALVALGLGWLTAGSLREEAERRRSAQQAERGEKIRLALWKLDGRVFIPLGLEGYRKFEDYTILWTPPGSDKDGSQYLSPLVSVELPEWMALHIQLDPKRGWVSPQIMSDEQYARLSDPKLELDLANVSDLRAKRFEEMVRQFPVANTVLQLKPLVSESPSEAVIVQANPFELSNNQRFEFNNDNRMNVAPYQSNPGNFRNDEMQSQQSRSFDKTVRDAKGAGQGSPQKVENGNEDFKKQSLPVPPLPGSFGGQPPPAPANLGSARGGGRAGISQGPGMGTYPQGPANKMAENPAMMKKMGNTTAPVSVHLGAMKPVWLFDKDGQASLFIIRFAKLEANLVYQGILIDWPTLAAELKAEVADDFPEAELKPLITPTVQPVTQMSALPVEFDAGPMPALPPAGWTPLRIGLALAWLAATIALGAAWFVGTSLIDLSERRMSFVSAVTHELRTPLTSLRLYLDMLTSGMITEEQKKQEYLTTLSHESERLHQLIENVLDFAKLEKRAASLDRRSIPISEIAESLCETWAERLKADGKEFVIVSTVPEGQTLVTDSRIVSQILSNLIDNARKYSAGAADPRIWLWIKPAGKSVAFEVEDRGPGIAPGERRSIFKPFSRGQASGVTGGAGLGLALVKQWTELLGGSIECRAAEGGTGGLFRVELPA